MHDQQLQHDEASLDPMIMMMTAYCSAIPAADSDDSDDDDKQTDIEEETRENNENEALLHSSVVEGEEGEEEIRDMHDQRLYPIDLSMDPTRLMMNAFGFNISANDDDQTGIAEEEEETDEINQFVALLQSSSIEEEEREVPDQQLNPVELSLDSTISMMNAFYSSIPANDDDDNDDDGDQNDIREEEETRRYNQEEGSLGISSSSDVRDNGKSELLHDIINRVFLPCDELIIRTLLQSGRFDVNAFNSCGETPLYKAAQYGHIILIRYLLQHGADPNLPCMDMNITPLQWSCRLGRVDIVKLLLSYGADVGSYIDSKNNKSDKQHHYSYSVCDNWTPLHIAAKAGNEDVVRVLLEHLEKQENERVSNTNNSISKNKRITKAAAVEELDDWCETPISIARKEGNTSILRQLLRAKLSS